MTTEPTARAAGAPGSAPARYQRVYVWQLPVRIFHWVNAACIAVLCATGWLIGAPMRLYYSGEAYPQFWFGATRFVHFAAAFLFTINLALRLYWGFVGNIHSRWTRFLPLRAWQRREIVEVLRADVLQAKLHGPISLGHNALASVIYLGFFAGCLAQVVTGFALYGSMSLALLPRLFAWVVPLLGSEFAVRFLHHLLLWFFVPFTVVHVYLSFYHDYIEGRGTVSSIIGGWKFERREGDGPAPAPPPGHG